MGRKPIFDRAMTPAERQRRRREKLRAARAKDNEPAEDWFSAMRLRPGDLVPFDDKDFEPFDPADFEPAELEPWEPDGGVS